MRCGRCRSVLAHSEAVSTICPGCLLAIAANTESGTETTDSFGNYQLICEIGQGGMGIVYLAEQISPVRREVALKVLKPGFDTAAVLRRFETERQALALMEHPNIATLHDAGTSSRGRPYFVIEFVDGLPITTTCDQRACTISQRLGLFSEVCRAIEHAHRKGVVHRDLKPSSVLVTERDGRLVPKVIDFRIARAASGHLTGQTMATAFGELLGTPEYPNVTQQLTHEPCENVAEERLFKPLGMTSTSYRYSDYANRANKASIHAFVDGKPAARYQRDPDAQVPAGSASSSVRDLGIVAPATWRRHMERPADRSRRRILRNAHAANPDGQRPLLPEVPPITDLVGTLPMIATAKSIFSHGGRSKSVKNTAC